MFLIKYIASLTLLILTQSVASSLGEPVNLYNPNSPGVYMNTSNGVEVKFPSFLAKSELNPIFNQIVIEDVVTLLEFMKKSFLGRIGIKRNFLGKAYWYLPFYVKVYQLSAKSHERQDGLVEKYHLSEYNHQFRKVEGKNLHDWVEKVKEDEEGEEAEKKPKIDSTKLRKDVEKIFDALIEGIKSSKVAHYLAFEHATVDGKPFADVVTDLYYRLRYGDCALLMKIFKKKLADDVRATEALDAKLNGY